MDVPCLWAWKCADGTIEYLESVSRDGNTTWTTDPNMAVHFSSKRMIPVSTVYLRFPMIDPLPEDATLSRQNLYRGILKWFEDNDNLKT